MLVKDLICCKKDYEYRFINDIINDDISIKFEKNNYYEVIYISSTGINILSEDSMFFTFNKSVLFPYFYDYFYTKEELRKLKINSLL